jgi:hypothetical protein
MYLMINGISSNPLDDQIGDVSTGNNFHASLIFGQSLFYSFLSLINL